MTDTQIALGALSVSVLAGVGTLVKQAIDHGGLRKCVEDLVKWRDTKSIDRTEFDDHHRRLVVCEGLAPKLAEVDRSIGVMSAEFRGFRELHVRDIDELKHGQRNMAASLDGLANRLGVYSPKARTTRRPSERVDAD